MQRFLRTSGPILITLLALVLQFQACTSCQDTVQFSSDEKELKTGDARSGNGEPYDYKPEPGLYVREVPGFNCGDSGMRASEIEVLEASIVLRRYSYGSCEVSQDKLTFDEIEYTSFAKEIVGHQDGIYQKTVGRPEFSVSRLPLGWCALQETDRTLHVVIKQEVETGDLRTDLVGTTLSFLKQPTSMHGEGRITHFHGTANGMTFGLSIDSTTKDRLGRSKGRLRFSSNATMSEHDVVCRLGGILDGVSPNLPDLALHFDSTVIPPTLKLDRSTIATYVDSNRLLKIAQPNVPRLAYDPVSKSLKGLIIEGASTNLLSYSEHMTMSPWSVSGFNAVPDSPATLAPDGGKTAEYFQQSEEDTWHQITRPVSLERNSFYTLSVFAKSQGILQPQALLRLHLIERSTNADQLWANFNLATGQISRIEAPSGAAHSISAKIESFENGWYRLSLTGVPSTQRPDFDIIISPHSQDMTTSKYIGDGRSGFFLWGAQLERLGHATSYIPTNSQLASRAADSITSFPSLESSSQSGTILISVESQSISETSASRQALYSVTGVERNELALLYDPIQGLVARFWEATSAPFEWSVPQTSMSTNNLKAVLSYGPNGSYLAVGGKVVVSPSAAGPPLQSPQLVLGSAKESFPWFGTVRTLLHWPILLPKDVGTDFSN